MGGGKIRGMSKPLDSRWREVNPAKTAQNGSVAYHRDKPIGDVISESLAVHKKPRTASEDWFGGVRAFDMRLAWWTPTPHKPGPDSNYRYCKDPATLGMVLKGDVWVRKMVFPHDGKAKTDTQRQN
jgi:hypothetical protein